MARRIFSFLTAALTYMLAMAIAVVVAGSGDGGVVADGASLPQQAPAAGFLGSDTCIACHEDQQHGYENSPHGKAANPRSPAAARGCESCHGPGEQHLEDPSDDTALRKFAKMAPRDVSATCLSCHTKSSHALLAGERARRAEPVVRHLPQRTRAQVGDRSAQGVNGSASCAQRAIGCRR